MLYLSYYQYLNDFYAYFQVISLLFTFDCWNLSFGLSFNISRIKGFFDLPCYGWPSIAYAFFFILLIFDRFVCLFIIYNSGYIFYLLSNVVILLLESILIYLGKRFFLHALLWLAFYSQCFLFLLLNLIDFYA